MFNKASWKWDLYILFSYFSESRFVRVQIVSDSIAKYVKDIRNTEVVAFPGININRLTNKIQNGQLQLSKEYTIIHVGTNDIHSFDIGETLSAFNNLITVVRGNSATRLVLSSILPRPVDHQFTGDKIKLVNTRLKAMCKQRNVQFLHTYRRFLNNCQPRRELFAIKDQGLHLNLEGTRQLRLFFINAVAHLLKK